MKIALPIESVPKNPIQYICLLLQSGLQVTSINFSPIDFGMDLLIGGFCSAIQTFMKEVFKDSINEVNADHYRIIFKYITMTNLLNEKVAICVMIVVDKSISNGASINSKSPLIEEILQLCEKSLVLYESSDYVSLDKNLTEIFQISLYTLIQNKYGMDHTSILQIGED